MRNIQYSEFDCKSVSLFCDIAQFSMKTGNLSTLFRIWSLLHILGIKCSCSYSLLSSVTHCIHQITIEGMHHGELNLVPQNVLNIFFFL